MNLKLVIWVSRSVEMLEQRHMPFSAATADTSGGKRSSPMRNISARRLSGFARKSAGSVSGFASVVHNLILDVRDTGQKCTTCVAQARNGRPRISAGQGWIPKPHRQADSTNCRQCMWPLATRPTLRDSRPRLRNRAHDTGALVAVSLSARIFDLASVCAGWVATRGWMLLCAAALCIALPGLMSMLGGSAHAGISLEECKLPVKCS